MRRTDTTREESNHLWYNKLTGKYHSLSGRQWISPGTEGAQKVLQKDGCYISRIQFRMWFREQDAKQ